MRCARRPGCGDVRRVVAAVLIGSALAFATPARSDRSAEVFYPLSGLTAVSVSPDGRWIAATAQHGREGVVMVQSTESREVVIAAKSDWVDRVLWESEDALILQLGDDSGRAQHLHSRLRLQAGKIAIDHQVIYAPGWLVDPLPLVSDALLWEVQYAGHSTLHRVTVAELAAYHKENRTRAKYIDLGERVAVVRGSAVSNRWVIDRDGRPRAAMRREAEGFSILMPRKSTGAFTKVLGYADDHPEDEVDPVGLTSDGSRVIVAAYHGRNTRALYEIDEAAQAIGREVFSHPEYDVSSVLSDPLTGDLVAAVYLEGGVERFHYFKAYRDRFITKLPEDLRGDQIRILSGTADRQVFAFASDDAQEPGEFLLRARDGSIHRIGRAGENVDRESLVPVESFRVKSKDGTEVEAFLTLPRSSASPAPLVVMPHGGPHSVADDRHYNPLLQYLADWGFAVVQVNYRGSSGYGRKFETLGRKEWAKGIEDDIDAAVEHAMARPDIDEERLCIIGGSYGGFSALASVVRHRDRYRCAVSFNGVSDVPLLYDSSDMADSRSTMAFYEEFVGDLETEREKLIAVSPAYHVASIGAPLLIIYGTFDRRVDPDHSHRMLLMLELYGREHQALEIEGAGHSLDRDEGVIHARAIRRFLSGYLMPGEPYRPDPRSPWDR